MRGLDGRALCCSHRGQPGGCGGPQQEARRSSNLTEQLPVGERHLLVGNLSDATNKHEP